MGTCCEQTVLSGSHICSCIILHRISHLHHTPPFLLVERGAQFNPTKLEDIDSYFCLVPRLAMEVLLVQMHYTAVMEKNGAPNDDRGQKFILGLLAILASLKCVIDQFDPAHRASIPMLVQLVNRGPPLLTGILGSMCANSRVWFGGIHVMPTSCEIDAAQQKLWSELEPTMSVIASWLADQVVQDPSELMFYGMEDCMNHFEADGFKLGWLKFVRKWSEGTVWKLVKIQFASALKAGRPAIDLTE